MFLRKKKVLGSLLSSTMRNTYYICLTDIDLGQLLDGLETHRQAWLDTARYLRSGDIPHETFICEECNDAHKAEKIAENYLRIVETIHSQRTLQDGIAKVAGELGPPNEDGSRPGFCIYVDTLCQGPVPIERDETGNFVVYAEEIEAQREIADITLERLYQFLAGERDFDDAITTEEYVVPVDVLQDGSVLDEAGRNFGRE
jgi:hypothetical protein